MKTKRMTNAGLFIEFVSNVSMVEYAFNEYATNKTFQNAVNIGHWSTLAHEAMKKCDYDKLTDRHKKLYSSMLQKYLDLNEKIEALY